MAKAYVALGGNLGDRAGTIRAALERLDALPDVSVEAVSELTETDPVGPVLDQPSFLNGAVRLETELPPRELLAALLTVEADLGRVREGPAGGPRPQAAVPDPARGRRAQPRHQTGKEVTGW